MRLIYEVRKGPIILEFANLHQIARELRQGGIDADDSYRKKGQTKWRPLPDLWVRTRRFILLALSFYSLFFLAGGLFGLHLISGLMKVSEIPKSWSTVPGRITYSHVHFGEENPNLGEPEIWYRFSVDHREHFGYWKGADMGPHSNSRKWVQSIVNSHPEGSPCLVYYDARHPSFSGIEFTIPMSLLIPMLIVSWMLIYLATICAWYAIRAPFEKMPTRGMPHPTLRQRLIWLGIVSTPVILAFGVARWFM